MKQSLNMCGCDVGIDDRALAATRRTMKKLNKLRRKLKLPAEAMAVIVEVYKDNVAAEHFDRRPVPSFGRTIPQFISMPRDPSYLGIFEGGFCGQPPSGLETISGCDVLPGPPWPMPFGPFHGDSLLGDPPPFRPAGFECRASDLGDLAGTELDEVLERVRGEVEDDELPDLHDLP